MCELYGLLLLQALSWIVVYDRDVCLPFWADYLTRDY